MYNSERKNLNNIQERINYFFKDIKILKTSLTHSSFSNKSKSYERLEFLGDSIIGMVVSESLFLKYPNSNQGKLSQQKSLIVNRKNLSLASQRINLIEGAYIGKSIDFDNKSTIEKLNCDLYESLTGAIFLDSNFKQAKNFIFDTLIEPRLIFSDINFKGNLIELCSKFKFKRPTFKLIENKVSDKSNEINFKVILKLSDNEFLGLGNKIKDAENDASKKALKFLGF